MLPALRVGSDELEPPGGAVGIVGSSGSSAASVGGAAPLCPSEQARGR